MAKIEILESAQRELEAIAELHMNLVGPNSARKITDRILDSLWRVRFQEIPNCCIAASAM